jgi:conjugative relaxase-like TrwC/TraI family protein
MLTVAALRSASFDYYRGEDLSLDEIGGEAPRRGRRPSDRGGDGGRWTGRGFAALGLDGPLGRDAFSALMAGWHPVHRVPLRSASRVEVVAYDLCFSAPKSVSAMLALGDDPTVRRVLSLHRRAADEALGYLERRAVSARRLGQEGRSAIGTQGLIGVGFDHIASRTGDPHLHTHIVVGNIVHGDDGRWTVLDGRGLFAHAPAAGSLYEAELRSGLTRGIGVTWERRRNGTLEIASVGPEVLGELSGRQADIAAHLAGSPAATRSPWASGPSWRARRVAWAATRPAPAERVGLATSRAAWRDRLAALGVGATDREVPGVARRLDQGDGHSPELGRGSAGNPDRAWLDERDLRTRLACRDAGVTRRDVVKAWSEASTSGASVRDVEACVDHWLVGDPGWGVAERRFPAHVVTADKRVVEILGPRPLEPATQDTWRRGAEAIEHYRQRWWRSGDRVRFDLDSCDLRELPARQLADHLAVRGIVDEVHVALGRGRGTGLPRLVERHRGRDR